MKNNKEEALKTILNKMFEIAGYEMDVEDVLAQEDEYWYSNNTMTEEQEQEWVEWSENYLRKSLKWSKVRAKQEMGWVNLSFGLRVINN